MIFLDSAATMPIRREVLDAMRPFLTAEFGNPSSQHALGEHAAKALADARRRIAAVLGCRASEITFTSGGTEADNLAIKGISLASPRGRHIVTSSIEHEAVLESCDYMRRHHGFEITRLAVDGHGLVDPEAFERALRTDTTLASIMFANNEVGTVQPVAELARIANAHRVPFHTDAVQAAGTFDLNVQRLPVKAMSISGHKVGAPKGVGLLFVRSPVQVEPLLHGGGQERGRRSGTENVASVVGMAIAMELTVQSLEQRTSRLTRLRDELIRAVLGSIPQAVLTGHPTQRLPGHASFCFPGTSGEAVLLQMQERGVLCSSGSACAAGRSDPSPVLLAMGIAPAVAQTAVRFTLSENTSEEDIASAADSLRKSVAAVLTLSSR
jgi:cysteine desulfurase